MSLRKLYGRYAMLVLTYPVLHSLTVVTTLVALVVVNFSMDNQVWEITYLCNQVPYDEREGCRAYELSRWELLLEIKRINFIVMILCVIAVLGTFGYQRYWSRSSVEIRARVHKAHAAKLEKARARLRFWIPFTNLLWLAVTACLCVEAVVWSYIV